MRGTPLASRLRLAVAALLAILALAIPVVYAPRREPCVAVKGVVVAARKLDCSLELRSLKLLLSRPLRGSCYGFLFVGGDEVPVSARAKGCCVEVEPKRRVLVEPSEKLVVYVMSKGVIVAYSFDLGP